MLISGTVRDNLLYGIKREVRDDELTSACVNSGAYDFISSFPEESGRTVLMVAHNRQAVRYADHVIVLEEGGVKFAGSAVEAVKESEFFNILLNGEEE